jgi:uncharacterized protein YdhG (YjbR/CyaY superfamily)
MRYNEFGISDISVLIKMIARDQKEGVLMWTCPKCGRIFARQNQSHYCGGAPADIDAYLDRQSPQAQPHLRQIAVAIRAQIPGAREQIKWSMPVFLAGNRSLSFAACKNHVSLYVGADVIAALQDRLSGVSCKKDAIYFPYSQPLPMELIREAVQMALGTPQKVYQ